MTVVLGKKRSKPATTTSRKSTMETSRPGELNPQVAKSKKKEKARLTYESIEIPGLDFKTFKQMLLPLSCCAYGRGAAHVHI